MKHTRYEVNAAVALFSPPQGPPEVQPSKQLLDHLPAARHSMTVNIFLSAVRDGATDPETVLYAVRGDLAERLHRAAHRGEGAAMLAVQSIEVAIAEHPNEARQLAAWALEAAA